MYFFNQNANDGRRMLLNMYSQQAIKDSITPSKQIFQNNTMSITLLENLLKVIIETGQIGDVKEEVVEALSIDAASYAIDHIIINADLLIGLSLLSSLRLHENHPEVVKVMKKALQKTNLSIKRENIQKFQEFFYYNFCYSHRNNNAECLQDQDFEKLQLCEAIDQSNLTDQAVTATALWAEGFYYEIKCYICRKKEVSQVIFDFIQLSIPYFTPEFKNNLADCILNEINNIAQKGFNIDYLSLPLFRVLGLFNASKAINDSYYETIIKVLESDFYKRGCDEISYLLTKQSLSNYEIQKISDVFDHIVNNYRKEYSTIIEPILLFLKSKNILSLNKSLFEKVKPSIPLCLTLFSYIEPFFQKSIIDDTYTNGEFNYDKADFISKILETDHYESNNLDSIFLDFLKLDKSDIFNQVKTFSNQEKYQIPIFNATRNYILEDNISGSNVIEICSLLNNFELSEQKDCTILEKISNNILTLLDSIEILPLFRDYKFLVINDIQSFADFAPHNSLFYTILNEKDDLDYTDIVDDLIWFDEDDASNCNSFHEFLLKSFKITNNTKFLFKLLEITEFNNNDDGANLTRNETIQALSLFTEYLQNTENKGEVIKNIVNILQNGKNNNNLKNYLINITNLKELIKFDNADEINTLTSSLSLNDDSLAFLTSIGKNITDEQIDSLFNSNENFYSKFIVASLFPSSLEKYLNEQKLDNYRFGCTIKHYKLCESLVNSVSSLLINQENGSLEKFVFQTSSKITELTIKALPESDIFTNPEKVQLFLSNLYNSLEQDEFELPFSAYLNRLKKGDGQICSTVWGIYFNNAFPPFYRTGASNYEFFKFISTSTSTFCELIGKVTNQEYSLYRPSLTSIYYQMFSNIPSIFSHISNSNYLRTFFKLLFTYDSKIIDTIHIKSIKEFLKSAQISNNLLESISFSSTKKGEFFNDTILSIEPKESVLKSLLQNRSSFTYMKTPDFLIIQIEGKATPDFVIDEELDLSPYCLKTCYYKLRSVGCEGNLSYLRQNNKYLKCTSKEVTLIDKIDSNDEVLLIYERVDDFEKDSQIKYLNQFWQQDASHIKKNIKKDKAILRCLQCESIDWSLFEKTDKFFDTSITLIKFGVKKVFTELSTSSEFSNKFFVDDMFLELFEDASFINKYSDEIIKLAKVFKDAPQVIFWNMCEHLNLDNVDLYFKLLYQFNIMLDEFSNRMEIITNMKDELINTPQFEKFFIDTIHMDECEDESINEEIQNHRALIPLMLKLSEEKYFHLYSDLISKDQFTAIVDKFKPDFAIYALENCKEKRSEFLPIAIKKLNGTPEWTDYINNKINANSTNINEIKEFYLGGENELAIKLLEIKYPPEQTFKQEELKNMFIDLLGITSKSSNSMNLFMSTCNEIYKYSKIFENDSKVTELVAEFVINKKQRIESYITDFTKLINILPPLKWQKVVDLYQKLFPMKNSFLEHLYTQVYLEKISLFLINLASRSIKSYPRYIYEKFNDDDNIDNIIEVTNKHIKNKKEFVGIVLSSFKHCVNNAQVFTFYTKDCYKFPYLFLKMLEMSSDCSYWNNIFALIYIQMVFQVIHLIYKGKITSEYCFYLDENGNTSKSSTDQVSILLMNFLTNQLNKVFLDPNNQNNLVITNQQLISTVLKDLNNINIEKLNDNVKSSFYKLLETIAYIYPLYTDQIVDYFIKTKNGINMYKRINPKSDTKNHYTNLIVNLFRELLGDREFIQSVNDDRFKKAVILLKSQFMNLLLTKDFTFEQVNPYLKVFIAIFKLKNTEIVNAFAKNLKPFPFILYLLYTKDSISTKINVLIMNFFSKVGLDDPYPEIVISFIKQLDPDDPQLKEKIAVLFCVLKAKVMNSSLKDIVKFSFNDFEKVALKRMNDTPKVKDIFDLFIIKMGLDF